MKRHFKMSLVLVVLLLACAFVLTGCNNALKVKADENAAAAQSAADAANKAQSELDAAKAELEKEIAANEAAVKKALEDLAAAKAELDKAIKDGDAAYAAALEAKLAELEAALQSAKDATDMLASKEAEETLTALGDLYTVYAFASVYYFEEDFAEIDHLYEAAYVRMIRALSIEEVKAAYNTFVVEAAKVPTVADSIYNALMAAGESTADLEYTEEVAANIEKAGELLDVVADMDEWTYEILMEDINAYGEDEIDLEALYNSYVDRYAVLAMIETGKVLKAEIEAALEPLVTPTSDFTAVRAAVTAWVEGSTGDVANDVAQVEGLAEAIDALAAAEDRVVALEEAKNRAIILNSEMATIKTNIGVYGATETNREAIKSIEAYINLWISDYFTAPYDVEKEGEGSVNYNMVDHARFVELETIFAEMYAKFEKATAEFEAVLAKVPAADALTLLSYVEIDAAWDAYYVWREAANLVDFDYDTNPSALYRELVAKDAAYKAFVAKALADYKAVVIADDFVVTLYNADAIQAVLDWYEEYAVVENGEKVFGEGYVLSSAVKVTKADYEAALALNEAYKVLDDAKIAESAALKALIDAIGEVTMSDKAAIEAAEFAYAAWLAGVNAPEGYTNAQFALDAADILDYDVDGKVIAVAREKWNALKDVVTNVPALDSAKADAEAVVDALNISDADKATTKDVFATIIADAKALIEATYIENDTMTADELKAVTDLAAAKMAAIADAAEIYEAYVVVADEAVLAELSVCYVNNMSLINKALTADQIATCLGMFASELATIA